jgi:hypothetical protein
MTVNSCSTGTAVTTVPCGLTITNLSSTANAANVTGAVQYRLRFYNASTNALVATKTQASRTFTFNTISGIYYNNTYKWTVAVDKGSGFGPESNNSCTITFAEPKTNLPCGVSYSNLNAYANCPYISGSTNYRFKFYNNTTNALIATKTQTTTYIYFNTVPALTYGNTYKWTVEVEYNNGTANVFGPPSSSLCTMSIDAPQTTVPCGMTYAKTGYASVSWITGANAYRYNFYDVTTNSLVATVTNTNTYVYFNLVPGLVFNTAYKWTVAVRYNNGSGNVFGPESSNNCIMNYGTPSSILLEGDAVTETENAARLSAQPAMENEILLNVYPNPNNGVFTVAGNKTMEVTIANEFGQVVRSFNLSEENGYEINIIDLPNGMYIVSGQNENHVLKQKIIVNQ